MPHLSDFAPDFSLPCDDGSIVTLSALQSSPVVLFFYPRDDTSGCTAEAKAFSDLGKAFDAAGVKVFGISKDTIASHIKFREKRGLRVALLSDADNQTCEAYGVWKEKSMYGKKFMGIERTTFLIDAKGQISEVWNKVKVPGHAEAVLAAVKTL